MSQPRLLGGRYELDVVVGRGGMAEVHRARDLRLDRLVAVKTLRHDLARDHTFQARFRREAQSAASLNHPSIIAVYDTGEDMVDGVSIPFIIMEYVDGRTLKELLDDDRRLLPERTAEITDGILRALEYSHRNGIVHRDIKPANVMLTRQAEVKVMDFGIARSMNDNQATMTQTSQVIGTAQYLSPEQARGERVDPRSDIYSTGCVLYELLTGGPPFTGDSPVSIAYQHVREDPVPPSQVDPEVPAWIESIVLRAMTKDREHRYQSAEEMREDLQRGLHGMPTAASTMVAPAVAAGGATTALPPVNRDDDYDDYDDYDRRGNGAKTAAWIALAVAVLASLILVGWLFMRSGTDELTVPDVAGQSVADAKKTLSDSGFKNTDEEKEQSDDVAAGKVIETSPGEGSGAEEGDTITLVVSAGSGKVKVPEIVGMSQSDANTELSDAGLSAGAVESKESDRPPGEVLSSDPTPGSSVKKGSTVKLVIAKAAEKSTVPDVTNMAKDQAEQAITAAGLKPEFSEAENGDVEPGTAFEQNPRGGTEVDPDSKVTVTLAKEPEEEESPEPPPTSPSIPPDDPGGGVDPPDFPWSTDPGRRD
ncbi:serine/threonine-protein kinase [Murinocardiopsis flavida]|uniref:non-specific serine/threonine protein kinase n=1 Tax=Murinocardiopsis flavida TaxID=645275 RepID=A0A2P8DQ64_9ACTN|nr:Stk1 family PASTA domain-containing Ser/Thr kinase [Murinocardiopsis flavida]PSK99331.1 serine/threonine-protein kinase [Murinocardiopsis flavida]